MQIFTPQGDFYFSAFALLISVGLGWACGYTMRHLGEAESTARLRLYYEAMLRQKDRRINELTAKGLGFEDFDDMDTYDDGQAEGVPEGEKEEGKDEEIPGQEA